MMKLYFSPSTCALAPHIVLREAKLNFTLEKVALKTHTMQGGTDYFSINPKGQVPALDLGNGELLTEGPIVSQYIADQAPNSNLIPPAGSMARYRVMEWQSYITSELHKSFTPLFNADLDEAAKKILRTILRKKYEWVDAQLNNKLYLTGETFTVADAYLFTVTKWAKYVSLDLSDLSSLQTFMMRVAERTAVQEALKAEG
jgi:glutathione S-transferase